MKNKKIILILILILILNCLTGCKNNENVEEIKKDKLNQEIEYLDSEFVSMMNSLNNITFLNYKLIAEEVEIKQQSSGSEEKKGSDNPTTSGEADMNQTKTEEQESNSKSELFKMVPDNILDNKGNSDINWSNLKNNVEILHSTWVTVEIDLYTTQADRSDIEEFGNILDKLTINVKNEDKKQSLIELSNLYDLLPKYMEKYTDDSRKIGIMKTKANILKAFAIADGQNWEEVNSILIKAEQEFSNVISAQEAENQKSQNINKIALLIRDLRKTTDDNQLELFYLKYRNTIEELNLL